MGKYGNKSDISLTNFASLKIDFSLLYLSNCIVFDQNIIRLLINIIDKNFKLK